MTTDALAACQGPAHVITAADDAFRRIVGCDPEGVPAVEALDAPGRELWAALDDARDGREVATHDLTVNGRAGTLVAWRLDDDQWPDSIALGWRFER